MQLFGFGHDGADEKCAKRDAVVQFRDHQAESEAKSQNGDQQHLVAAELCHVGQQARHHQDADHQGRDHEQGQPPDGRGHFLRIDRSGNGNAG
ncbi:hypothetical protein D3C83_88800 [compost metagenome]